MAKTKSKKKKSKTVMCDPAVCDECMHVCDGSFLCGKYLQMVVEDWTPTKYYMMCGGKA